MDVKKLIILFLLIVSFTLNAQLKLTTESQISVLTMGPGTALNDAFGHTAIRIKDPVYKFDIVFDYGRYDFETEHFYLKFAQGKLDYEVIQSEFKRFFRYYQYNNRSVKEQVLNLSTAQKTALYEHLKETIKPENKSYPYDFFYNNCATKLKDDIENILDNQLVYYPKPTFERFSFRNLIRSDLNQNSWGSLGIDLDLGSKIDKIGLSKNICFYLNTCINS